MTLLNYFDNIIYYETMKNFYRLLRNQGVY